MSLTGTGVFYNAEIAQALSEKFKRLEPEEKQLYEEIGVDDITSQGRNMIRFLCAVCLPCDFHVCTNIRLLYIQKIKNNYFQLCQYCHCQSQCLGAAGALRVIDWIISLFKMHSVPFVFFALASCLAM